MVRPDGLIGTVVARDPKSFNFYDNVAVAPDDTLLIANRFAFRISRVSPAFPVLGATQTAIAAESGNEAYIFDVSGYHLRTVDTTTGTVLLQFTYDNDGYLTKVTDRDGNVLTIERTGALPTAIVAPGGQRTTLTTDDAGYLSTVVDPAGETTTLTHADGLLTALRSPRGGLYQFTYDTGGRLTTDSDPAGGSTTLTKSGASDDYTVTKRSAEGRTAVIGVTLSGSASVRTMTGTNGLSLRTNIGADQSVSLTTADGMVVTGAPSRDQRFGTQAPVGASLTVATPGGLSATASRTRAITLADPKDLFTVATRKDTFTFNGATFTTSYDGASRTLSFLSPAGRRTSRTVDSKGRVASATVSGITPLSFGHDARGRLAQITQGTRTTSYTYDDGNRVTSVKDPLGHTVGFSYDADGRVTAKTLADGRVLRLTYDEHGNVTTVTPPARPAYLFAFNAVDQGTSYTPPAVAGGGASVHLDYNGDHQVIAALRPDGSRITRGYDGAGRLSTIGTHGGAYQFAYAPDTGMISSMTSPNGESCQYTFDGFLPKSLIWSGPVKSSISFGFDSSFHLVSRSIAGAPSVAFTYDADGLLTGAANETIAHDASSGFLTGTAAGVVRDTRSYDEFGDLSDYVATIAGTQLLWFHYTRDVGGRISAVTETYRGAVTDREYEYDVAGRLTHVAQLSGDVASYAYDDNSNR
ncbi:MAG TPA: hypothetical protein VNN08_11660, partial [Thermoanaerobaculia bacterium]|nr:hypothetical protein [Thermoanaerobaculia bacterium]